MMFSEFRTRSLETERLDRGEFTRDEYLRWQKEMWFIHRMFGETRALKRALISDVSAEKLGKLSILDVGAGSGTLLTYLKNKLPGSDLNSIGLEMSPESARGIADEGHLAVQGNALVLPFADKSIDYVFCTLFLHHLNDSAAMKLLLEMRRVARRKLIVIDLERNALSYITFKLLGTLLLQRFTRDDGSLSIKRSFRPTELKTLAQSSGLENLKIERSAIGRLILTADG
ncbi:MAG: methyltransferase domain-containing protein [bacterium]|nr:methyltransferase domain-containing protein [bacterium]